MYFLNSAFNSGTKQRVKQVSTSNRFQWDKTFSHYKYLVPSTPKKATLYILKLLRPDILMSHVMNIMTLASFKMINTATNNNKYYQGMSFSSFLAFTIQDKSTISHLMKSHLQNYHHVGTGPQSNQKT